MWHFPIAAAVHCSAVVAIEQAWNDEYLMESTSNSDDRAGSLSMCDTCWNSFHRLPVCAVGQIRDPEIAVWCSET